MASPQEVRANLLMAAIAEDRTELRAIKERIYTVSSTITLGSFAISVFFFGPEAEVGRFIALGWQFFGLIDTALLVVFWALFLILLRDLKVGQEWLEGREKLLTQTAGLQGENVNWFDIFPKFKDQEQKGPKISHNTMYWVAAAVTVAISLKLIAVVTVVSQAN